MPTANDNTRFRLVERSELSLEFQAFLIDREARGLSPRTLGWYREKLWPLQRQLMNQDVRSLRDATATMLRAYLLLLVEEGHNPGGVKGHYQAMRTIFRWYEAEYEPEGWRNPIAKVPSPKVPDRVLEPVHLPDLRKMVGTCQPKTFSGDRDRALLLFLLDTGCRRAEVIALNVGDINLDTGAVLVRQGKGAKFRTTFMAAKTRKAVLTYLRHRACASPHSPLWVTDEDGRLSYHGLFEIIRRRAAKAGVAAPALHSFRRAFALSCLRGGMDVYSLQRLMGHSDLSILRRYLAQTEGDLQQAHQRAGPVDRLL